MHRPSGWLLQSLLWLLPLFVGACAGVQRDASLPINDPNEQQNRAALEVNQATLHPLSVAVKAVTPGPIHDRLHDLNANLKEPRIFANDILQGRFSAALHTAVRFMTNSTIGIGGLFDVAAIGGLPQESGDFGQTLFVWGVEPGPYVIFPYLGPSTLRDGFGTGVDMAADPLGWTMGNFLGMAPSIASGTLDGTVRLRELKEAEDASIDFYAFLRSAYYQTRRAQLREAIGLPKEEVLESPATATQPK